jgi:hypothetical protein
MIQPVSALRFQTPQKELVFYPRAPGAVPINYPELFKDIKKRSEIKNINKDDVKKKLEAIKKQVQTSDPGFEYEKKIEYALRNLNGQLVFTFIPYVNNKNGNGFYIPNDAVSVYAVNNSSGTFTLSPYQFADIKDSKGRPSKNWTQAGNILLKAPYWVAETK